MPKIIEDMQIYQAVMEVVVARGYAGATTRQIADAAGVSEVTLFRKFGSKAGLIKRTISSLVELSEFESATRYTGDIHADLLRVLQAYRVGVIQNEHFFFVLFAELSRNPELADSFNQPLGLFESIGELIRRYQADGVLKPEPPLHSVASLLGPLIYFSMISRSAGEGFTPAMDLEAHVQYFLEGRASTAS